ncbi:MAG: nascent polypeptide-associated complex protein [Candidatus Thermoplasmatota archaeon]|nr:nascent polypeptide-associated complex protein [Candidatus Thermoplasmatota archaeon]MBU1940825.1 nascent polypeptide-associated complex protein [Candidatus Thermoplasmatota archaeon]
MMPGKMNPRQLQQMMKRFGINIKTVENVEKVLIQTDTKEYIFNDAEVTIMDAQGQKTFQIAGNPVIRNREDDKISEDIQLIMDQTGKTEKEARDALTTTNGDIAEAILRLTEE